MFPQFFKIEGFFFIFFFLSFFFDFISPDFIPLTTLFLLKDMQMQMDAFFPLNTRGYERQWEGCSLPQRALLFFAFESIFPFFISSASFLSRHFLHL